MIKKITALLLVCLMLLSLVGCNNNNTPTTEPTGESPYWYKNDNIAINNFIAMKLDFYEFKVTDADLQLYINYYILHPNAEYKETYEGIVEKEDFLNVVITSKDEAGNIIKEYTTGEEGYMLYVGLDDYMTGLDAAVLGKKVGDTVKFNSPVVIDGKTINATVEAKIMYLTDMEYPEATDELAEKAGWKSLEAFKDEYRTKLEEEYGREAYNVFLENAKKKIIVEVYNYPEEMLQSYITKYEESLSFYAALYSVTEDEYLAKYANISREDWNKQIQDNAKKDVETELMLIAIMESLGESLDDEAYKIYLDRMAEGAGYSSGAALEQEMESQGVSSDLRRELTMNYGYDLLLMYTNLRLIDWSTGNVIVDYIEAGDIQE